MGAHQRVDQVSGPVLIRALLGDRGQSSEVMRVTQTMADLLVAAVGLPAVMHRHPSKVREHAGFVHRLSAPLGMHREMAQRRGGRAVHPVAPPSHTYPGLIEVCHLGGGHLGADLVHRRAGSVGGLGHDTGDGASSDRCAQQIRQRLRGPLDGQTLGEA
jgi:hypothetical protein